MDTNLPDLLQRRQIPGQNTHTSKFSRPRTISTGTSTGLAIIIGFCAFVNKLDPFFPIYMRTGLDLAFQMPSSRTYFYLKIRGISWGSWFRGLYTKNILGISNYQDNEN